MAPRGIGTPTGRRGRRSRRGDPMGGSQGTPAKEGMSRIVLRPEAQADLLQARDWYKQEGSEFAEAFADSFEAMIARIEAMPKLYAVAFTNIRRGKLQRFPY